MAPGVLIQVPDRFLRKVTIPLGIVLPPAGRYGVGLVFLPQGQGRDGREQLRDVLEQIAREQGLTLGKRVLPIHDRSLGASARAARPVIEQVFVAPTARRRRAGPRRTGRLEHTRTG
jgi:glutamate synthase (NADPH/NADH) large chain